MRKNGEGWVKNGWRSELKAEGRLEDQEVYGRTKDRQRRHP